MESADRIHEHEEALREELPQVFLILAMVRVSLYY